MKYGLIGEKLGHSFSKEIHAKIADYEYILKELAPYEVAEFMEKRDFCGINVTIPYKETVIPFLDEINDSAKKIGSVNTVVNRDGKLYGYNTDYMGAWGLIEHANVNVKSKKVLILGTGGTAKTMHAVVGDMGADEIIHVSRSQSECAVSYDMALREHADAEVIINTTPVGMYPKNEGMPISLEPFTKLEGVIDVIYNPLRTKLVSEAKARGVKACGGLYMLYAQALYASAIFRDITPASDEISSVYKEVLAEKKNIVLAGMPSCGKSSVGRVLAERLKRDFYDADEEIVKREGVSISEIFARGGEDEFRRIESEVISDISKNSACVISTGGGAILKGENVRNLKQNGTVVFIDRPLDMLVSTSDRPLSNDADKLQKLYEVRYPIYTNVCDIKIDGSGETKKVADMIIRRFTNEDLGD